MKGSERKENKSFVVGNLSSRAIITSDQNSSRTLKAT